MNQIARVAAWVEAEAPILWLLGKTQAGKTSIVAQITGQARDQIGNGFEPFTAESRLYAFPETRPVLRFLDTRGLGDRLDPEAFDASRLARALSQVLLVVVRAEDLALEELLQLTATLRRAHPGWPLIVAQTCLHQLYPPGVSHPLPYPYQGDAADFELERLPDGLRRSLQAQRRLFQSLPGTQPQFVPVDFTRPEQGVAPCDYGAAAFWAVLEQVLPEVVADLKTAASHPDETGQRQRLILPWALAAATANAVPVPVLGGLGSASVQAAMVAAIARSVGLADSRDAWKELLSTLGGGFALGYGGSWLAQQVLKLGIGWGSALSASWTFAVTWAIGEVALLLFSEQAAGRTPDREQLRAQYRAAYARALHQARQR